MNATNNSEAFKRLTEALDDKIPFRSIHVWIISLIALGALFDGMEQFASGYVAPILRIEWNLTDTAVGYMTSVTFIGLALGAIIAGVVADRFGRKVTFMYNLGLYTIGALVCALAPNLEVFLIARFFVGIGLGGELNVGVTMLSELMPTRRRGAATAVANIACGGLGLFASAALAALILSPGVAAVLGGPSVAWRWYIGFLAVPALLIFIYRIFLPETPRYLLTMGRVRETNVALTQLYRNELRQRKDAEIIDFVPRDTRITSTERQRARITPILRGRMLRNSIILWIIALMAFGAQIGLNAFLPTILTDRGIPVEQTLLYTMIINIGGFIGGVLAAVGGRYWARRTVLTLAGLAAAVLSVLFTVAGSNVPLLLITGLLLQMMMITVNTTAWLYSPELYSTRVRGIGTGAFMMMTAVAGSITPVLIGSISGQFGLESIFIVIPFMYLVLIVAVRFGAETLGKSLEELSDIADGRFFRRDDSEPSATAPSTPT